MIARLIIVVLTAMLFVFPVLWGAYYTTLVLPALGYSIALLGLNLLFGYSGLLSVGHALFVSLGAYVAAYATDNLGILQLEAILGLAVVVAVVVALPIGFLCVRYVKIYFAILTLSFSMLFYSFLFKFYYITGGDEGIRVHRPTLLGFSFDELDQVAFLTGPIYYYFVALLVVATVIMWRIVHSPFGLHLRAIRENAEKARYVGINARRYRLTAFVIAAVFGSIGGVVLAIPIGLVTPELAYWVHSAELVLMLLFGGFDNFFGPLLGAFVFIFLQDQVMSVTEYWRFVFGALLVVIVIFFPSGMMSLIDYKRRWSA